jgi:hypothetical protein
MAVSMVEKLVQRKVDLKVESLAASMVEMKVE